MNVIPNELSIVSNRYVTCFYQILERMIKGMETARRNASISHNFIVQMIPHHKAAIEMSRNLLCYTTYIPLQEIALQIIEEQTKSIRNMEHILCQCSRMRNTREELCHYQKNMDEIIGVMFHNMKDACISNNINESFMHEMIPHHLGAIEMSKNTLDFPICCGLVPILEAIITSQEQGVCQMETLLKELTN